MKKILFLALAPCCCFAQFKESQKIPFAAKIVSDSAVIKGYFVASNDSIITLSSTKRYSGNSILNIPVNSIKELRIRNKSESNVLVASGVFVFGFILTAGLTKNAGDFDNDGKTSFFELLLTAIEGTTSGNRRRRNTALIVGAAGGTTAALIQLLSNKKLSLVFPLTNRRQFFKEKKYTLNDYTRF